MNACHACEPTHNRDVREHGRCWCPCHGGRSTPTAEQWERPLVAGVDYEPAVCDVCGEDEHTPEQLRECIDSATGIERITYRGRTITPGFNQNGVEMFYTEGRLGFETESEARLYIDLITRPATRRNTP